MKCFTLTNAARSVLLCLAALLNCLLAVAQSRAPGTPLMQKDIFIPGVSVEAQAKPADVSGAEEGEIGYQLIGSFGFTPNEDVFVNAYGVAANKKYIYVADPDSAKVFAYNRRGKPKFTMGSRGTGEGQFLAPAFIEANDKYVVVYDTWGRQVALYTAKGEFLGSIKYDEQFSVASIGIYKKRIYVLRNSGKLEVYNKKLTLLNGQEDGEGQDLTSTFRDEQVSPVSFRLDGKGRVYAYYRLNGEGYIRIYNKKRRFVREIALRGYGYLNASRLRLGKNGRLLLLDGYQILEYDSTGKYRDATDLREYSGDLPTLPYIWDMKFDARNRLLLCDGRNRQVVRLKSNGKVDLTLGSDLTREESLFDIKGMASDGNGQLFVYLRDEVKVFSDSGAFIKSYNLVRDQQSAPLYPNSIACNKDGELIASAWNGMFIVDADSGTLLSEFGRKGTKRGEIGYAMGVDVSPGGEVLVGDYNNKKVLVFSNSGRFKKELTDSNIGYIWFLTYDQATRSIYYFTDSSIHSISIKGKYQGKVGLGPGGWGRAGIENIAVTSIATDKEGNLYAGGVGEVRIFDKKGGYRGSIFSEYEDEYFWIGAEAVQVDEDGTVYIADRYSGRVYVYVPDSTE